MIDGKSVLAIVPARGGSKGVPRKNVRLVSGKPLIQWTFEEAGKSRFLDRVILSSEDPGIIETVKKFGGDVPFVRPAELAQDETPGIEPVIHAIQNLPEKFDLVVLLQPTSPLRTCRDIDDGLLFLLSKDAPACISVCEADKSPFWSFQLDAKHHLKPVIENRFKDCPRQELPIFFQPNGAVYIASIPWLLTTRNFYATETVGFVMPKERSLDIDTELDLRICQFLLNERLPEITTPTSAEGQVGPVPAPPGTLSPH